MTESPAPFRSHEHSALEDFESGGTVTLYHGTQHGNAHRLLRDGKTGTAPLGANLGQPHLLYVTTNPENAIWFAQQAGGSEVLTVKVPASQLQVDPEDGVHDSVSEELRSSAVSGVPASLAVSGPLPPACFSVFGKVKAVVEEFPIAVFLRERFADRRAPDGSLQKDNFVDWFGRSACVDDAGLPQVCFHGTSVWERSGRRLGDIEAFDRLASVTQVRRAPSIDTVGSWFSTNSGPGGAEKYSGGVIYPVFLKILDPWVTTFREMTSRARKLGGLAEDQAVDAKGVDALRVWLQETGRDGICIRHDERSESTEFQNQTAWIALEPSQIKSAIGNAGTFDIKDPSISDAKARQAATLQVVASQRASEALSFLSNCSASPRKGPQ